MNQLTTYSLLLTVPLAGTLPATQTGAVVAAIARPDIPFMSKHIDGGSGDVIVTCKADDIGLRGAACRALRSVLAARASEAGAHGRLDVDIEWLRVEPEFLLARLVWRQDGGARQAGPEIEVSVNDRNVNEKDARHLAEALVKATPLPL